jgi:hypothetical protein
MRLELGERPIIYGYVICAGERVADGKSRPVACPWRVGALRKWVCLRFASGPCCDFDGSLCAPHAVMNDVRPDGGRRRKRSSRAVLELITHNDDLLQNSRYE